MHNNNLNIVGYLQKKNFFNRSPSPNVSPSSRFSNYVTSKTPEKKSLKPNPPIRSLHSQADLNKVSFMERRKTKYESRKQSETSSKLQYNTEKKYQSGPRKFDSSRVQIKMCLEDLSRRVGTQLRLLESTLTDLTIYFENMFQKRLVVLKQKFIESAEGIFTQTKNNLQNQIRQSDYFQFKKAQQTKNSLIEADGKLKRLKVEMDSNWKKVAGQILMQEMDDKLQIVIKESQKSRKQLSNQMGKMDKNKQEEGWVLMKKGIDMLIKAKFMQIL